MDGEANPRVSLLGSAILRCLQIRMSSILGNMDALTVRLFVLFVSYFGCRTASAATLSNQIDLAAAERRGSRACKATR